MRKKSVMAYIQTQASDIRNEIKVHTMKKFTIPI